MKTIKFCILLSSLFVLSACSKDSGPSQSRIIKISGDPLTFLSNTKKQNNLGLPVEMFKNSGDEWQIFISGFQTQEQDKPKTQEQVEEDNAAPTTGEVEKDIGGINLYKMPSLGTSPVEDSIPFESIEKKQYRFIFSKRNERLFLKDVRVYGFPGYTFKNFQIHHYSIHREKEAFSVLFSFDNGDKINGVQGRALLSANFVKKSEDKALVQKLSEAYNYMFGPGVKMAWDQDKPLLMTFCSSVGSGKHFSHLMESVMDEWRTPLEDRLNIGVTTTSAQCPPFSDLNTHVISHVPRWILAEGPDGMVAALTMPFPDYYKSEFVDSDIFLLESEWDEAFLHYQKTTLSHPTVYSSSRVQNSYKWTMVHEMGHVLGLHHIFDETPSVMSYRENQGIYSYDIDAIHELYPRELNPNVP